MHMSPAELMKKAKGVSMKPAREEPSKYTGVTKVMKGSKVYWQAWAARSNGEKAGYVGVASTAKRAADLLEEHVGTPPAKKSRSDWFDVERQRQHFRALMDVYTDKDGKPVLPSDLGSSIKLETMCTKMYKHAPALQYIAFMGKYGPFKQSLMSTFSAAFDPSATTSQSIPKQHARSLKSLQSMVAKLRLRSLARKAPEDLTCDDVDVLIQIAQISLANINDVDLTAWIANVGRGNCYYSGPTILLQRFFEIISRSKSSCSPRKSCQADAHIRAAHVAGHVLNKISTKSVKSLKSYLALVPCLQEELRILHPPALNPDKKYSIPWILRTKLISMLGRKQKLPITAHTLVSELHGAFPDAKEWLDRFDRSMGAKTSVKQLTSCFKFSHGVHLLTMFFCLFGDTYVLTFSPEYIIEHHDGLHKLLQNYTRDHGVVPHPAVLLKEFDEKLYSN